MINLLCAFRPYDHLICLNQDFFLDLARTQLQEVFQSWNGCSFLQYPQWTLLADFEVSSDASGALGYGAVVQGHWFSGASLAKQVSQSIGYKHLFPIVVAAYLRGPLMGLQTGQRPETLRSGISRAPCHHVLGSLSVLIDSSTFLLFH